MSLKNWSNSLTRGLTDGFPDAFANSVYVSGSDIYVVGHERIFEYHDGSVWSKPIAKLWINGVAQNLIDTTTASYAKKLICQLFSQLSYNERDTKIFCEVFTKNIFVMC